MMVTTTPQSLDRIVCEFPQCQTVVPPIIFERSEPEVTQQSLTTPQSLCRSVYDRHSS